MKLSISNAIALSIANSITTVGGVYANTFNSNKKAMALELARQEKYAKMFNMSLEEVQTMEADREQKSLKKALEFLSPDYKGSSSKALTVSKTDTSIDIELNKDFIKAVLKNQTDLLCDLATPIIDIWCILKGNDAETLKLKEEWLSKDTTEEVLITSKTISESEVPKKVSDDKEVNGWSLKLINVSTSRILDKDGEGYITVHNFICTPLLQDEDPITVYDNAIVDMLALETEDQLVGFSVDHTLPKSLILALRENYKYPALKSGTVISE